MDWTLHSPNSSLHWANPIWERCWWKTKVDRFNFWAPELNTRTDCFVMSWASYGQIFFANYICFSGRFRTETSLSLVLWYWWGGWKDGELRLSHPEGRRSIRSRSGSLEAKIFSQRNQLHLTGRSRLWLLLLKVVTRCLDLNISKNIISGCENHCKHWQALWQTKTKTIVRSVTQDQT